MGGTITSINPSSIVVGSGEYFMTISGTGLSGNVTFDGGAGRFELEPNQVENGFVVVWVPIEIVNDPGTYSVTVGDSNAVAFKVLKLIGPRLQLLLPEHLLELAKSREGSRIFYEVAATGPDPETIEIKCSPESGSTFPFGQSRIDCYATDATGEQDKGSIDVNVWDGTPPVLELPKAFEMPSEDERGAYLKYDAKAFDEIDGQIEVSCAPKSGTFIPNGRTTVICEATDASLNPTQGSFDVMVMPRDIGKLELKVPDKVVEATTDGYGAEVVFEVIAFGSADPDPVVECTPPSGSYFLIGSSKVYCMATDDFGQRAEGGFTVEVVERLGLKLPDVTAEATSPTGTPVTWEGVAEDWNSTIRCTPDSGSLFALGTTEVECESTDDRGRAAAGKFKVNVADTIAPHIGRIHTRTGTAAGEMLPVQVSVETIDAADAMPRCSVTALTSDAGGAFDWRVRGDLEFEVRATAAGRPMRIQVTCVDASGNRSTGSVPFSFGERRRIQISN